MNGYEPDCMVETCSVYVAVPPGAVAVQVQVEGMPIQAAFAVPVTGCPDVVPPAVI